MNLLFIQSEGYFDGYQGAELGRKRICHDSGFLGQFLKGIISSKFQFSLSWLCAVSFVLLHPSSWLRSHRSNRSSSSSQDVGSDSVGASPNWLSRDSSFRQERQITLQLRHHRSHSGDIGDKTHGCVMLYKCHTGIQSRCLSALQTVSLLCASLNLIDLNPANLDL